MAFVYRLPSFIAAVLKGFIPLQTKGYLDIVITDVLIDETGTVVDVQYGRDIGDHYNFDKIKEFSLRMIASPEFAKLVESDEFLKVLDDPVFSIVADVMGNDEAACK